MATSSRLLSLLAPSYSSFLRISSSLVQFNNNKTIFFSPLRFNRYCSSSSAAFTFDSNSDVTTTTTTTTTITTAIDDDLSASPTHNHHHPWPEWVNFIDGLKSKGYFTDNKKESSSTAALYGDMKLVKDACLSFGRDRFDIFRSMSTQDIQIIVEKGCPNLLRKAVNSAKRLRAYLKLDEGDVCGTCNLRGSCDRAYIMLNDSESAARTIDIVRILFIYALDPLVISGETKPLGRDDVELSAKKLLLELSELADTPRDPDLPRPAPVISERKKQPSDNRSSQNVEMRPGDWMCTKCDFMNYARNTECLKCKAEKPKRVFVGNVEKKKGDWDCPMCSSMNFASNRKCFRCQEPRPKRHLNPGDWECPSCDFLNFSRNTVCKKCNHDRPLESARQNDDHTWRKPY